MELHENLYALGLRLGREVFDDPDSFRGALDDFLDEDSATTGDINLLVDAVRLGAFASMTSMIGSGAQVIAAVEEAGSRLARDRGSADVAGAQWACAILAFAIGKASAHEVQRYRTQQADPLPSEGAPSTRFPQQPLEGHRGAPTRLTSSSAADGSPPSDDPLADSMADRRPEAPSGSRKRTPILLGAAAAVVLVAAAVAIIAAQDADEPTGPAGSETTAGSAELPVDLDSVRARYSGLARDVTVGVDACEHPPASDSATEVVECAFPDGTLTLMTFESDEDFEAHRSANTRLEPGNLRSSTETGTIQSVDARTDAAWAETSSLYWDSSEALQAGKYQAASRASVDRLMKKYYSVEGVVEYPTKPEDKGMIALAKRFLDVAGCDRVATSEAGELEESYCPAPHNIDVWLLVFETMEDFETYRDLRVALDPEPTPSHWSFGKVQQGTLADYEHDDTSAVRYWDRPECRCAMEAFLDSGDRQVLTDWWLDPFGS